MSCEQVAHCVGSGRSGTSISRTVAPALAAYFMLGSSASALDWGLTVGAGALTTDNVTRSDVAPISSKIAQTEATILVRESTRTVDIDALGDVVHRDYNTKGISPDTSPTANAFVQWTISPERIAWVVNENLGQRAIDPNDGLLPPGRERLNVFATGPDLQFAVHGASWLTTSARYGLVDYQNSPLDMTRLAGRIGFEHQLESGSLWSINLTHAHTKFDESPNRFDIQSLYTGYVSKGGRGVLDANIGVTVLKQRGDSRRTGFFADVRLDRRLSGNTEVTLDLIHRFADSADVFRRRQDLEPDVDVVADVVSNGQSLRETAVDAGFAWMGRRTRVAIGGIYHREKYFSDAVSAIRSEWGSYLQTEIGLFPRVDLLMRGEWRRVDADLEAPFQYAQAQVSLAWQFFRTMGLNLGAEHYLRDDSSIGTSLGNYEETRYFLMLDWRIRDLSSEPVRPRLDTPASRRLLRPRQTL